MDRRDINQKWYSQFIESRMVLIIEGEDYEEIEIPAKYEVCGTCDGKGSHVNPSIDSNGLSREDFDEDPDFREDYFSGVYDIDCNECHGNRVSPTPDWDRMKEEERTYVQEYIESYFRDQAEQAHERKMGY
jgi:hypothetical protein